MSDLRDALGRRRTSEILSEAAVPLFSSLGAWWLARRLLVDPSVTRPLTTLELFLVLGSVVAVFCWYTSRQLTLANVRRPWWHVAWCLGMSVAALGTLGASIVWGFAAKCAEAGGDVVQSQPFSLDGVTYPGATVCQIGAVPDNVYLPGTILRASWDGSVSPALVVGLVLVAVFTAVGMRHVRLAPSRLGIALVEELAMAPAAGSKAVFGANGADVQACGNPTLWGEPCGQMYPIDRVFEPGEWCVRCAQVYRRSDRSLSFDVVSLFTADIDVLNGLERLDALSWPQGDPAPPDARLSGQERWVRLGRIEVPDVITVANLLELVKERLPAWSGNGTEAEQEAFKLATDRASRLAGWFWIGHATHRLTYARPTDRTVLGVGSARLKDLPLDSGERLALQLDIGLLPLELRTGFRQTFLDPSREPVLQNTKQDVWVPVAPPHGLKTGEWVPRLEGEALRAWLSLDRLRPDDVRGVSSPRPYVDVGATASPAPLREGSLDLVRMPLDDGHLVPDAGPGASVSEWAWFEEPHLELLRQQALVMVAT